MNSRIREVRPGLLAERVAESTHIAYAPIAGDAAVTFTAPEFLLDDVGNAIEKLGTAPDLLRVAFDDLATRRFADGEVDPVSGASLDGLTGAGVSVWIKRAFHFLHNERAAAQAAAAIEGGS